MSNWQALKNKLAANKNQHNNQNDSNESFKESNKVSSNSKKRRREISETLAKQSKKNEKILEDYDKQHIITHGSAKYKHLRNKIVALDCEMVGIGISGKQSALARCSIVDFYGNKIYDKIVRPPAFVTDFRTEHSGIRKKDLRSDNAISLMQCQEEVAAIIRGKIVVGHALQNDFQALLLKHDKAMMRDTARFRPYMRPHNKKAGKFKPRALRDLSRQFLSKTIQTGEHDSSEDAIAALNLYKLKQEEWEAFLANPKSLETDLSVEGPNEISSSRLSKSASESRKSNDDQFQPLTIDEADADLRKRQKR